MLQIIVRDWLKQTFPVCDMFNLILYLRFFGFQSLSVDGNLLTITEDQAIETHKLARAMVSIIPEDLPEYLRVEIKEHKARKALEEIHQLHVFLAQL